ncbi:type I-F CRISPR-associated protein Csy2 [Salinicola sp. LHM]|jgi:CRISPR-associated protein Csy2|uniref:type I-F CRISPR-associated protein Csy2 n=1 Tax=unclassified Salinicola TaxID=2634022 RepID=UPI0008DDEF62|nr:MULTISPECIES: type I-F CRISPR-associated protein Csy2 [unclassified Salinicola]OHZ02760.1 type I-F CRISPR-associated protein Csy2 [Salinicola sp. MIT1003]WQH32677.1 type I-F CRISPR-associated protein Csy2 [Salinicola sp. LHM]
MSTCPNFNHLLVLPRLQVQNANAVSSPLTHGFPSMTAFLGLMWALERKAHSAGLDLKFKAVGVVCHDYQELVTESGFVKAFRLTRNPVGRDGKPPGIVEEGRIHLDLSLVLAVESNHWQKEPEARQDDAAAVAELLASMRIAGGTLIPPAHPGLPRYQPYVLDLTGTEADCDAIFRKARMRLLPGFTLVSRDDRLKERLTEMQANDPKASPLDAWLSLSRINWHYEVDEETGKGKWLNDRRGKGWVVPIPIGYGALGELHPAGSVSNARDAEVPFHFVESLYSVGEWISPHRIQSARQLLWYADSQPENDLYRCRNDYDQAADSEEPAYHFEFDLD